MKRCFHLLATRNLHKLSQVASHPVRFSLLKIRLGKDKSWVKVAPFLLAFLLSFGLVTSWHSVQAQTTKYPEPSQPNPAEPQPSTTAPPGASVKAMEAGQYVLEFNRSPIVGNRLQLRGIYDESRLRFTRPRSWEPKTVKVLVRYRHSAALYATRSNLTVLLNGTSIGSVPLNKKIGEIGTAIFDVSPKLIQDYNEIVVAALQNNSPTCTQDPFDPSLWTEILPDSKLVFDFQPKPIALNFTQYPYPIFDNLSLEPNQIAYLQPNQVDEFWLTAATRLQTSLGRFAQYRPMDTRLVKSVEQLEPMERLVVIGTPKTQPALKSLNLPIGLQGDQLRDEKGKVLAPEVGVLVMTTTSDRRAPILVATGNGDAGVAKAVQFLVQKRDQEISTGQVVLVEQLTETPSPEPRDWTGYLPTQNYFQLKDLTNFDDQPYGDITVRGSDAPAIEYNFRALPDDKFVPENILNLRYSYGPQVNPLTSLLEVQIDGLPLIGKKLDSVNGGVRETLRVPIPEDKIKPNSKIQVRFQLDPRERRSCNRATDQQLWGKIHADSEFNLNRENVAQVPDLKLLQSGYPFAAPQDLSNTSIALPDKPTEADLLLMLEVGERLGRLSKSDSLQLSVHRASKLPEAERNDRHIIAIGDRTMFPFPEAFEAEGFTLQTLFQRQRDNSQIRTLPDAEGVVKQIISPWNRDRVLLILSGQTEAGLQQVRDLFAQDNLFFQLREDTALISATDPNPSAYDPNAYNLEFLQRARQKRLLSELNWQGRILQALGNSWVFLAPGTLISALFLYGIFQSYLKRFKPEK
jgi:cellulose synthase operon protein B